MDNRNESNKTNNTQDVKEYTQNKQNKARKSRNKHHHNNDNSRDKKHKRLRGELGFDVVDEAVLGSGAGDNHTRCHGNQQRRYLRAQAVADGCEGVGVQNRVEIAAALHHTDDNAADKVYERGDDGHNRVALDELRGTVH